MTYNTIWQFFFSLLNQNKGKHNIHAKAYTGMATAHLVIIAPNLSQFKHLSTNVCMNVQWDSHTIRYYSALERNTLPKHVAMRVNLKIILLSGRK